MTNKQIIMINSIELMKAGKIAGSGKIVTTENGNTFELPEAIHTFQHWKQCGYSVIKGSKAVAAFPIWKHVIKKLKDENGNFTGETSQKMIMKKAAFFAASQVEPLKC